jgi:lysophospholipase L1-like esterase
VLRFIEDNYTIQMIRAQVRSEPRAYVVSNPSRCHAFSAGAMVRTSIQGTNHANPRGMILNRFCAPLRNALLFMLAVSAGLPGCSPQMKIEKIEPDSCNVGDIVVIQGFGFGRDRGASTVIIHASQDPAILSWSDSEIAVVVPEAVPFASVKVTVRVEVGGLPLIDTRYLTVEPDPILYRMLAFGDSITAGVSTPYGGYTYHLEALLDAQKGSTVVINAGVGGEITSEGLNRFESTLTKWNDIQYVLLLEGANDVTDSSGAGPLESIVSRLRDMIRIARDDYAREVILGTLLPRLSYENDREPPSTVELVEGIRDLAVEENVLLGDHYSYFTGIEGWEAYFSDAMHPNHHGYQVLADSWFQGVLEDLLP